MKQGECEYACLRKRTDIEKEVGEEENKERGEGSKGGGQRERGGGGGDGNSPKSCGTENGLIFYRRD